MKTIGILGGLGPEATVDYYKRIITHFNENADGKSLNYPEMVIYSVNMSIFINHLRAKNYEAATEYISSKLNNMADAGADFGVISANTPHMLFNEIQKASRLPLLSIVEATAKRAKAMNLKRCGLFGTKFTMESAFFEEEFSIHNIQVVSPNAQQIQIINQKLFSELEIGIYKEDTKKVLLGIVHEMKKEHNIDSLILGCTEFPLMFTEDQYDETPFLNTTALHVEAILEKCVL